MTLLSLRMALPSLHDRFDILAMYVGHLVRFLAGAAILLGVIVVVGRQAGVSAAELRESLPSYVLVGLGGSALLAAVTTWAVRQRKGRHRQY